MRETKIKIVRPTVDTHPVDTQPNEMFKAGRRECHVLIVLVVRLVRIISVQPRGGRGPGLQQLRSFPRVPTLAHTEKHCDEGLLLGARDTGVPSEVADQNVSSCTSPRLEPLEKTQE